MPQAIETVLSHLGTVLRYIAPGFVALFTLITVNPSFNPFQDPTKGGYPFWIFAILGALTGFGIYSVHVGVVVPVFSWIAVRVRRKSWVSDSDKSTWEVMFELEIERWKRRASEDLEIKSVQRHLNASGAMLNFLYCSSYPLILMPPWYGKWLLFFLGWLVLVFAIISDIRITYREFWAVQTYPGGKKNKDQSTAP